MTQALSSYFRGSFFEALGMEARHVQRRVAASAELADLYGITPTPPLAQLVDFLATHEPAIRMGDFGWFGAQGGYAVDWLPGRQNALAHALGQPFRTPAALAGALAIGCDPGGNPWLVSLDARRGANEVLWIDHDTDEPRPFASSLEAFAFTMGIADRGDDEVTARERRALHGRVDGGTLARTFGISGLGASHIEPWSDVPRRLREVADIVAVLAHCKAYPLAPVPPARTPPRDHPSDVVADLLRLFLRGEDDALGARMTAAAKHRARFVRDAVHHLRPLLAATAHLKPRSRLTIARAKALAPPSPPSRSAPASRGGREPVDPAAIVARATAAQARGRHEEALAELERAVAIEVEHAPAWLARCYSLSELERWKDMKTAAQFATRLEPRSSYAHQQLAIATLQLGEHEASVVAARRAIALDAKNAYARFNLAVALAELSDVAAIREMREALRQAPALQAAADDPDVQRLFDDLAAV